MGRAISGLLLGFAIVFGVAFWARTCLPEPGGSGAEWLHRKDSIIVQMKTVGGMMSPDNLATRDLPDITLYGDGTLLQQDEENRTRIIQTSVSNATIRNLLSFIDAQGFFNFDYQQPTPPVSDSATTYIYASTKLESNAVKAYALGWEQGGDEWNQFRRLTKVSERIQGLADAARGGDDAKDYLYDSIVLDVQKISPNPDLGSPVAWPFSEVDLGSIVGDGTSGDQQFRGEQAKRLADAVGAGGRFPYDDKLYIVAFRPVLPHEENFPEFEPPS